MSIQLFLDAMLREPEHYRDTWLMCADWLEERDDPRCELIRLTEELTREIEVPDRVAKETRMRALLYPEKGLGLEPVVPIVRNELGMEFVFLPAGKFLMGSPLNEPGRQGWDREPVEVEVVQPSLFGRHPVTQSQYQAVMGETPSHFAETGPGKDELEGVDTTQFPVERVSWNDAMSFCDRLSTMALPSGLSGDYRYVLPSECDWEYACRGGTTTAFCFGDAENGTRVNCRGHFPCGTEEKGPFLGRTSMVGDYPPNSLGLFDCHGNVLEWCADFFNSNVGAAGPGAGARRVCRGGSWDYYARFCRSAYRIRNNPDNRNISLGFRLAVVRTEPRPAEPSPVA